MKMVKSLLLGSAAGLVAVSAGQAADLPVKAKPVEYVKVCSLYGAGFYYMPGTDICIKIGGYARAEATYHSNGNFTQGPVQTNFNDRATSELTVRARAYITADAREQTAWGTARAYVAVGVATADIGNTQLPSILGFNRAFIQWAGITAGITQSFYDFYSAAATSYRGYLPSSDTGDSGWWVWAYTAQLGNGLSASISAEARRGTQIVDVFGSNSIGTGGVGAGAATLTGDLAAAAAANTGLAGYGGAQVPDIVGNIRYDQTWGSAQIMAAAHEVNAPYYTGFGLGAGAVGGISPVPCTAVAGGATCATPGAGGPGTKWGFVVGAGLRLNFPMVAQGDFFQAQVNYTQGALRYLDQGGGAPTLGFIRGNSMAYGLMSDCVYSQGVVAAGTGNTIINGTGCELTTGWGVNAAYEHYWTPQFHESFVFGYMHVQYDQLANNNLCNLEAGVTIVSGGTAFGSNSPGIAGCSNNWSIWTGATRLQYDFTKTLYLGVEFMYQRYQTATGLADGANTVGTAVAQAFNSATTQSGVTQFTPLKDQNNLAVTLRMHKDFLP